MHGCIIKEYHELVMFDYKTVTLLGVIVVIYKRQLSTYIKKYKKKTNPSKDKKWRYSILFFLSNKLSMYILCGGIKLNGMIYLIINLFSSCLVKAPNREYYDEFSLLFFNTLQIHILIMKLIFYSYR